MKTVELLDSTTVQLPGMKRIEHWRKGERHEVPDDVAELWKGRKLAKEVSAPSVQAPKAKTRPSIPRSDRGT